MIQACGIDGAEMADYGVPPNPPYVSPWSIESTYLRTRCPAFHGSTDSHRGQLNPRICGHVAPRFTDPRMVTVVN